MTNAMVDASTNRFELTTLTIKIRADMVPWDTPIFGFNVAQISSIKIINQQTRLTDWFHFQEWLNKNNVNLVSCRLHHNQLNESILLENQDFKFIEMVLHPHFADIKKYNVLADNLIVSKATPSDIPNLIFIAERAFQYERYHVDPRIDRKLGDLRYGRWVKNCLDHPSQCLLKILDGSTLLGFFIVEYGENNSVYWHLTAISPELQGKGYGLRVWNAMLSYHQKAGNSSVSTTISARNNLVLNLYSKLNFRFLPPEMTFHWIRNNL
jgi:ribosomal protein S18 acetylase RimI-like enzyme